MRVDVLLNGADQFGDALEHAALQAIGREAAEKALDRVPRSVIVLLLRSTI